MKLKRILIVALIAVMLFALASCGGNVSFMSQKEIDKLVNTYGEKPEMVLSMEYTITDAYGQPSGSTYPDKTVRLNLKYELLLSELPITVVNFINLITEDYYNEKKDSGTGTVTSHIFSDFSSSTNAWRVGEYTHTTASTDGKETYRAIKDSKLEKDYTIAGEFYQNDWKKPLSKDEIKALEDDKKDPDLYDHNPDFSMFSLAMYHENSSDGDSFNQASTAFFLTSSSPAGSTIEEDERGAGTENHRNFAVFANLVEVTYTITDADGEESTPVTLDAITSEILDDFSSSVLGASTTMDITEDEVDDEGEPVTYTKSLLKNLMRIVEIKMVDTTKSWENLPKSYIIKK